MIVTPAAPRRRRLRWIRPLLARDEGSSLLELGISISLVCSFIFCFMEVCLAVYSQHLIAELAYEGTRYAMVHGASCPTTSNPTCEATASQVNSYVSAITIPNLAGGTITPNTTYPDGNEAVNSRVKVSITYVFPITMPFVPKGSIDLYASSTAYIVQ